MAADRKEKQWPAQCCVPAFLGTAIAALSLDPRRLDEGEVRRTLAEVTGVTMSAEDDNPWDLPMSTEPSKWGVSLANANESFEAVRGFIASNAELEFVQLPLNEIAFEMYEDTIIEFATKEAVVAISFDNAVLQSRMGRDVPMRRAHHVVRLTPLAGEIEQRPNILSEKFGLDYNGSLRVFDDSGEIDGDAALVHWQDLLYAAYSIDGGLWIVRPKVAAGR